MIHPTIGELLLVGLGAISVLLIVIGIDYFLW